MILFAVKYSGTMKGFKKMPTQPEQCTKHHMILKEKIDKVDCVLFGCSNKPNEIPLVTKVNIMFNIMIFLSVSIVGALGTLAKISMNIGAQMNQFEQMQIALDKHINNSETQMRNYETRIIYLESCLAKKP